MDRAHLVRTNLVPKGANTHREKKCRCANDSTAPSIGMPYPAQDTAYAKNHTDQIGPEEYLEVIVHKLDAAPHCVIGAHRAKTADKKNSAHGGSDPPEKANSGL